MRVREGIACANGGQDQNIAPKVTNRIMGIVGATPFSCKSEEKTMSYILQTIHVDQDVEVELDVQELLENINTQDILRFVRDDLDLDDILAGRDTDDVLDCLPLELVVSYVISRRPYAAALLREIADKLEGK